MHRAILRRPSAIVRGPARTDRGIALHRDAPARRSLVNASALGSRSRRASQAEPTARRCRRRPRERYSAASVAGARTGRSSNQSAPGENEFGGVEPAGGRQDQTCGPPRRVSATGVLERLVRLPGYLTYSLVQLGSSLGWVVAGCEPESACWQGFRDLTPRTPVLRVLRVRCSTARPP